MFRFWSYCDLIHLGLCCIPRYCIITYCVGNYDYPRWLRVIQFASCLRTRQTIGMVQMATRHNE